MASRARIPIINDETPDRELFVPGRDGWGLDLSARPREGHAYGGVAEPFPRELLIPRSEWQARIQERKERRATLREVCDRAGLKVKDQQQTNYCWCNSPTYALEVTRVLQNEPPVVLSPASVGGPITGYRNVGGWGKQALERIVSVGAVPVEKWPANAISSRYATPENFALAANYRVVEWWEATPRSLDETISCLFHGLPLCSGLNFWGHEVTYLDPDWIDGAIAVVFANSWNTSWGDNGYGILQGSRILPDDAVIPRTALPPLAA